MLRMNDDSSEHLRILWVEDTPGDVMALQRAMRRRSPSTEIVCVPTAEEALALLKDNPQHTFGLFLIDLNLPGMKGLDLLKKLQAASFLQNTPMMILTSSQLQSDIDGARQGGASGYLLKPMDVSGYNVIAEFLMECWDGAPAMDAYRDVVIPLDAG